MHLMDTELTSLNRPLLTKDLASLWDSCPLEEHETRKSFSRAFLQITVWVRKMFSVLIGVKLVSLRKKVTFTQMSLPNGKYGLLPQICFALLTRQLRGTMLEALTGTAISVKHLQYGLLLLPETRKQDILMGA